MTALCRVAQSQADTAERIIVENTGYAQVRAVFTENKRAFIEMMLRKKIFDLQIIIVIVVFKSGIPSVRVRFAVKSVRRFQNRGYRGSRADAGS